MDLGALGSFSHVLTAQDLVDPGLSRLVLDGDFTSQATAGDAVFVSEGLGQRGFAVISGVSGDGSTTQMTVEHWFELAPQAGSQIEIGPWEIVTVEHEWPALAPSETEVWRGIELTAVGGPIVNFAWDAWRPDVAGIVFGIAGWGGKGYTPQLQEAVSAATSGAGKTTVLQLLLRFYDPEAGTIRLDGVPIDKMRLTDLRRRLALVPQEPVIFADTVRANILFGRPDAAAEEVEQAARRLT